MPPLVSCIVLNYRSSLDAEHCVAALLAQTLTDLEVILIDNHSEDDSLSRLTVLARRHGNRVRTVAARRNLGYGQGNDLGIHAAQGEFLLIVNPDTILEQDTLETMVCFLREHPDVGIVGPKLIEPDGTVRDSFRTFPTFTDLVIKRTALRFLFRNRLRDYLQWDEDHHQVRDVDWIVGACLLMRREVYHDLRGFDPRFFLFLEDTDLCRRCWQRGLRVVYLPQARARDSHHRLSSGGFLSLFTKRTVRIHMASALKYFWKWRGMALPRRDFSPSLD